MRSHCRCRAVLRYMRRGAWYVDAHEVGNLSFAHVNSLQVRRSSSLIVVATSRPRRAAPPRRARSPKDTPAPTRVDPRPPRSRHFGPVCRRSRVTSRSRSRPRPPCVPVEEGVRCPSGGPSRRCAPLRARGVPAAARARRIGVGAPRASPAFAHLWLAFGEEMVDALERTRVRCGFAAVRNAHAVPRPARNDSLETSSTTPTFLRET